MKEVVEELKKELREREEEVAALNGRVEEMKREVVESFENYKKAVEKIQQDQKEKVTDLEDEKQKLALEIEKLKEVLEDKDTSYQLLLSNLNLERKQKVSLEKFKERVAEMARHGRKKGKLEEWQVFEELRNKVEKAIKLENENLKIKNDLHELELEQETEREQWKKLQSLRDALQAEVESLKRTVDEQSAYLTIQSPRLTSLQPPKEEVLNAKRDFNVEVETTSAVCSASPASDKHKDDPNNTIKQQKIKINNLNSEILILTSQIECLEENGKNSQHRAQVAMKMKEKALEELEEHVSKLNQDYQKSLKVNQDLSETIETQKKRLEKVENVEKELKRVLCAYDRLSSERVGGSMENEERLRCVLLWLEKQTTETHELKTENERLKKKSELFEARVNDEKSRQEEGKERVQNTRQLLARLEEECGRLVKVDEEVSGIQEKEDRMKKKLNEATEARKDKEKRLAVLKRDPSCGVHELLAADGDLKKTKMEEEELCGQLKEMKVEVEKVEKLSEERRAEARKVMAEAKKDLDFSIGSYERLAGELKKKHREKMPLKCGIETLHSKAETVSKIPESVTQMNKEEEREEGEAREKEEETEKGKVRKLENEDSIVRLERLCDEMKEENEELRRKYTNVLETNEILSEKFTKKESLQNEVEEKERLIGELRGDVEAAKRRLERVEEEKETLLLQKEKADVILKIEQLKNLSVCSSHDNHMPPSHFTFSPTDDWETDVDEASISSHLKEVEVKEEGKKEENMEKKKEEKKEREREEERVMKHNGVDARDNGKTQEHQTTPGFSNGFISSTPPPHSDHLHQLRTENRRIFLNIMGLQSCLRRKLSLQHHSTPSHMNGNAPVNGSSDSPSFDCVAEEQAAKEEFLHCMSNKCFDACSTMVSLEEEADTPHEASHLSSKFSCHREHLQRLQDLLQGVLEKRLNIEKACELLVQQPESLNGVKLKSDYVFKASAGGSKKSSQSSIRVIRTSSSDSDDRFSDTASPQKLKELQHQLRVSSACVSLRLQLGIPLEPPIAV